MSGPDPRIARWIERELRRRPPKAKSLVVTVWGDAIAPHGGAVWLSGLIRLLAPLGMSERLVRTSVYRLAREGWLAARTRGRRSLYRLTPSGLRRFEDAYRRIYAPPQADWNGRWDVLFAPASGLRAAERAALRKELSWAGFGTLAPGLFVRPEHADRRAAALGSLRALGMERRATLLSAGVDLGSRAQRLKELSQGLWDLRAIGAEYGAFVARFGEVIRVFERSRSLDPEQCFVVRTLLIHDFRRVSLHDPQLPAELLPARWPAPAAYGLCRDFYRLSYRRAERHLAATLESESGPLPHAAGYFYRRFGGL